MIHGPINISVMKICPVGAELFYTDEQTDMEKLIVAFSNFVNTHKKKCSYENLDEIYYLELFTISTSSMNVFKLELKAKFLGYRIGPLIHDVD